MKRFFILPFVLGFLFILEVSGLAGLFLTYKREENITISCESLRVEFSTGECEFISPSGLTIKKGRHTKYPLDIRFEKHNKAISGCSVSIIGERSDNDYGKWTCILKIKERSMNASVDVDRIIPKIKRKDLSKKSLYFKRGEEFKVTCSEVTDWDYCRMQSPNGLDFLMTRGESQAAFPKNWLENAICETTISNASNDSVGEWICEYQRRGNSERRKRIFSVKVVENYLISEVKEVEDLLGKKAIEFTCRKVANNYLSPSCYWTQPEGRSVDVNLFTKQYHSSNYDFSCQIRFNYFYRQQMGNWTCRLYMDDFNEVLNVNLQDSYEVISNAVEIRNTPKAIVTGNYNYYSDSIKITCDAETDEQRTGCILKKFDELDNSMFTREINADGICIFFFNRPTNSDFGNWTCSIEFPNMVIKSTVNVRKNFEDIKKNIERDLLENSANKSVKAKLRSGFTVQCKIPTPLRYCRIKSPSGVIYESRLGKEPFTIDEEGLKNGDCSVFIKSAKHENNGTWTCTLGARENQEFISTIQVEVSETYLIPNKNIDADLKNAYMEKILSCKTSDLEEIVDYCRWTHPDGTEIMEEEFDKFKIDKSDGACSVRLKNFDEKDFGQWKCHAFITRNLGKEYHAIVEFGRRKVEFSGFSDTVLCGFLIFIIILCTSLGYFGYIIFCKKKCTSEEQSSRDSL